jgi:acetoacetyl-CoA synthetase
MTVDAPGPEVLWRPSPESMRATRVGSFACRVAERRGLSFGDPPEYDRLWRWSVGHLDQFWGELADWSGVLPGVPDEQVLTRREMPGAVWFPGRRVDYAEQALRWNQERPALVVVAEDTDPVEISWTALRAQVGAFAATLRELGVRAGDRVAGYLPNIPEAVVALLGAASIGAVCRPARRTLAPAPSWTDSRRSNRSC